MKTFPYNNLDILQFASAAQRGFEHVHGLPNRQLYDWYIQPLERGVAINMPLTE
jgi:hypothetical protein